MLLIVGLLTSAVWAADVPQTTDPFIAHGDALYSQRSEIEQNRAALAFYDKASAANPQNAEAQWKAARAQWWIGTEIQKKSEQVPHFNKGISYGETAIKLAPQSGEAHFWLGSNYASYGYAKGALTSLFLIKSIRREMQKVLELAPAYTAGGADRVLGILDYKIPGFMGGDKKRALQHLQNALTYAPTHPVTLYYLAEYSDVMGQEDQARQYLKKIEALPPSSEFQPEFVVIQAQIRKLSKKLKI